MSDPAIEAAQRALAFQPHPGYYLTGSALATAAAREMAKSVQELHVPFEVYGAEARRFCAECSRLADLNIKWPCETAKRVYPSEELGL
ncbi:hypothetical protein MABM_17460 [Mycobacteroides abscessus]|uniref:hypothetical protein n=1 Tax=Mycobacteroides abscessus TaxID=36809 RepID=UPI0005A50247|nr:hypothetical protein [Mycobacteroides abscessus]BBZ81830.1 hypothetical protein MABM_17460 [Mycobacteroides abscessus]